MMVTVEWELGCAALRSILIPLSLLGLVPFPQRPTKRWRVRVRVKAVAHTQGMELLPWALTSRMQETQDQRNIFK